MEAYFVKDNKMNEQIKNELISLSLNALEQAVFHISRVEECDKSNAFCNLLKSAVTVGEAIIKGESKG